ncbi:MAG: S-layer homology domain-containing protein [Firmicutes bacterium]|nr:S-layer homology domain-containing protein [Bacillota bacterium]
MKKRFWLILLCLCLALGMFSAPASAAGTMPFTDVKEGDWFYEEVLEAYEKAFFNGTSATTFTPNGSMTRGMFVTVLGRMAGVDEKAYEGQNSFADVGTEYYAPYVAWASKYGIASGIGGGLFAPDKDVSRQEMAAFFIRYFEKFEIDYSTDANITTKPADYDSIADWAKEDVMKMWKHGLLVGYENKFAPYDNATRAQVATLCCNVDAVVDDWKSEPEPPVTPTFTVTFYDGDRVIDTMTVETGKPLANLPAVEKSSKENAVLLGYFADAECKTPFYATEPITADTKVYAKYEEMDPLEQINLTTFTQIDQKPDLSFVVAPADGSASAEEALKALTLVPKGSYDPVKLEVKANGDGTFTVYAPEGFEKGANYELQLADGWNFDGKADTIRTASFGIDKEQVANLETSNEIKYIQNTPELTYDISKDNPEDGILEQDRIMTQEDAKELTSDMIDDDSVVGSFDLTKANADDVAGLKRGDILCIYAGLHPEDRVKTDENGNPYVDGDATDPAVYVKVDHINGDTVNFVPLDDEEQHKIFHLPVNVPFKLTAEELAALGETGTANIREMDTAIFAEEMNMAESESLPYVLDNIAVGDFVTFFTQNSSKEILIDEIYYGRITAKNGDVVTYEKCTVEDIEKSMELYVDVRLTGDDLISDEEEARMEAQLLAEVEASGFAEEAAYAVADLVTKTDNFRDDVTIQSLLLTDENGNAVEPDSLNIGKTFKLCDDVELTVEIIKEGDQIHFTDSGSVQLAIGLDASFEVESKVQGGGKIVIDLNAVVVEELSIEPTIHGQILLTKYLHIPYGIKGGAVVDILNYSAFSFTADIYTVEEEDESLWDQMKGLFDDPIKVLGDYVPAKYRADLETFDDVMDEIHKLEDNIEKMKDTYNEAKDTYEQYMGYVEDVEMLWQVLEDNDMTTKEAWGEMCDTLEQTSITSDLLAMVDLTNETGLSTEYYESLDDLMVRYQEVVTKKTGWVTLCKKEIFATEICANGFVVGVEANFLVHADMSISLGSNMEYEVGKRYDFWFKVGLCSPDGGSTSMDILDEKFAFQFYVMGRLGVKLGVDAKLYTGIGSGKIANIGIRAEFGPYLKLYGFFVYENDKYRAANTSEWHCDERMAGAFYLDFGMYFKFDVDAEALSYFEKTWEVIDEEYPLVDAGVKRFYYQPLYRPAEDEVLVVPSGENGVDATPYLSIKYIDLVTGDMGAEFLDTDDFIITFTNPAFYIDEDGEICVDLKGSGVRYLEGEMSITYKYGKMAFCDYDMNVTLPLVWTNLSDAEFKEYYTASVSVNNMNGGADILWSNNVLKGALFNLPTAAEIHKLLNWNEYKYDLGKGYGDQKLTDLYIIDHINYPYLVDYDTYTLTVKDVVDAKGNKSDKTFTARYGESFDFSALAASGTDIEGESYLKYMGVTTDYTYEIPNDNGESVVGTIDLTQPIDDRMAEALLDGMTATAVYADDGVKATFEFVGIDAKPVEMTLRRGEMPDLTEVNAIVDASGYLLKEITPVLGGIYSNTTYKVICERPAGVNRVTLAFEEKGGSEVEDLFLLEGSVLGALPTPERDHYTFDGWYSDAELTTKFEAATMPVGGATVYAKWTAETYTVTLNVNGGKDLENNAIEVTYGEPYGELPKPEFNGSTHGFAGWFTAAEGGEQVTAESELAVAGNHTLYAQWKELITIPAEYVNAQTMGIGDNDIVRWNGQPHDYIAHADHYGQNYPVQYFNFVENKSDWPDVTTYKLKYRVHDEREYLPEGEFPVEVGSYDVLVYRDADDTYAKFEKVFENNIVISKANLANIYPTYDVTNVGYTYVDVKLADVDYQGKPIVNGGFGEIVGDATIVYHLKDSYNDVVYSSEPVELGEYARIYGLTPGGQHYGPSTSEHWAKERKYYLAVSIYSEHYNDHIGEHNTDKYKNAVIATKTVPTTKWSDNASLSGWYDNATGDTYVINTAYDLANFAAIVNGATDNTNNFKGKTVLLGADIDLSEHQWDTPIGKYDETAGKAYPFLGTFDGQGHTIKGLTSAINFKKYDGLFGSIDDSSGVDITIKNVTLEDAYVWGHMAIGGIIGNGNTAKLHVENCTVIGTIASCFNSGTEYASSNTWIGGIAGLYYGSMDNCTFYGSVGGKQLVGGIIGDYEGKGSVTNCTNYGMVYNLVSGSDRSKFGGICGGVQNANANVPMEEDQTGYNKNLGSVSFFELKN